MQGVKAQVIRDVSLFRCVKCGDQAELVLRRGDAVDHSCNWGASSTWWVHRVLVKPVPR